jgi:hypothetical protein
MAVLTPAEQSKKLVELLRNEGRSFKGDPGKARAFLVRMGVLDRSGKRLAKRYR